MTLTPRRERAVEFVQLGCMAWIVWLPVSQALVLYPSLLLVAATSLLLVLGRRTRPSRAALAVWGVYYAWALTWTAISVARGNEGVLHQAALWLGLPLLWGIWSLSLRGGQVRRTIAVLLSVGCVSGILMLLLALQSVTGSPALPSWLVELQDMRAVVSSTGEIEENYLGLSSLVGVASFALAAALIPGRDDWLPRRATLALAACVLFAAASVSGRRGLLLVVFVVSATAAITGFVVVTRRPTPRRVLGYAGGVVAAGAAVLAFAGTPVGANIGALLSALPGIGHLSASEPPTSHAEDRELDELAALQRYSDQLRQKQFTELIAAWKAEPVTGHGFGATLGSDFTRNDERPWMFEAEPLQALMNVGILGLVVLAGPVLLLMRRSWQALVTGMHIPCVIGGVAVFAAVLLACATNPYLQAPGHGWMLFLAAGITSAVIHSARLGADEPSH